MQNINNKQFIKILIDYLKKIENKTQLIEELESLIEKSFISKNLFFSFNNINFMLKFENYFEENCITPEIFSYFDELKLSILNKQYDTGSYYTNKFLVNNILEEYDFLNKTILDPSAGSGNFLISLLIKLKNNFKNKNDMVDYISKFIFFNDIENSSSLIYLKRLNFLSIDLFNEKLNNNDLNIINKNIFNLDFLLNFNLNLKFDCIIGNPPYLGTKSLGSEYLDKIKLEFNFTDDLYSLFIFKSLKHLNDNGFLSFVTSSTYLTISTKKKLRELLINNNLYKIILNDRNNFNILTNTSTLFLNKSKKYTSIDIFEEKNKNINLLNKIDYKSLLIDNRFKTQSNFDSKFDLSIHLYNQYIEQMSTSKKLEHFHKTEDFINIIKNNDVVPLGLIAYIATGVDFKGHNNSTLFSLESKKYNQIESKDDIKYNISSEEFINGLESKLYIKAIKGSEHIFVKWTKEHVNFLKSIKAPLRNLQLYGDSDLLYCKTSTYDFFLVDKNTLCINTAGACFIKINPIINISISNIMEQINNNEYKNYIKNNINNSLCLTTNDLKMLPIKIR